MERPNWHMAFLALILGCLCWYLVSFEERVASSLEVRLEFSKIPENLVPLMGPENRPLEKVSIVVNGPRSLVRALDPNKLGYPVDLSGLRPGENVIVFDAARIPLAGGLEVVDISPPRMTIRAEEMGTKVVPVRVVWRGELAEDWELKSTRIVPPQVEVIGPKSLVEPIELVETVELDVEGVEPGTVAETLVLSLASEVWVRPTQVDATLEFGPVTKRVELDLALTANAELPPGAVFSPQTVKVALDVPIRLLNAGLLEEFVRVVAALPASGRLAGLPPGEYDVQVDIDRDIRLPRGVTALSVKPASVRLKIPAPSP